MVFQWSKMSQARRDLWKAGAGVLLFGSFIKYGYFVVSRSLIIDNLKERDVSARKYLQESRDFSEWAAKDRAKRAPALTPKQREELNAYLMLMATNNSEYREVYPDLQRRHKKEK